MERKRLEVDADGVTGVQIKGRRKEKKREEAGLLRQGVEERRCVLPVVVMVEENENKGHGGVEWSAKVRYSKARRDGVQYRVHRAPGAVVHVDGGTLQVEDTRGGW